MRKQSRQGTPSQPSPSQPSQPSGAVQSVERSLELLELMADAAGEVTLSELASSSGLPAPTIHRLLRTLIAGGYVRQEESRKYALGPRLIRLGESASRLLGSWARPCLDELMHATGETANLALLDGDKAVYVAQVPSRHAMRMFTEVGRRVELYCTGVGKALLAQMPDDRATALLKRADLQPRTPRTLTDHAALLAQLDTIRDQGYAVDDGEQEVGVRCVAVTVPDTPIATALSISGPAARITDEVVAHVAPELQQAAARLSAELRS